LEASLGTDNSERFEEYYNTALNLLSDLKDLEEEQEETEREEIGEESEEEESEEEIGDKKWFKEDEIEYEKETGRKRGMEEF
jgi:hypothetical protein